MAQSGSLCTLEPYRDWLQKLFAGGGGGGGALQGCG